VTEHRRPSGSIAFSNPDEGQWLAPVETPSPKQRGCARTTDIFVGRARASGARPLLDHPERSIGDVARIAPRTLVTKGTNSRLVDRRLV